MDKFISNPEYVDYPVDKLIGDPNVPAPLTEDMIEYIYSRIPPVESPVLKIKRLETNTRNMKIAEQLREVMLKPSKFQKFADQILNKAHIAAEQPGNPDGNLASESVAEPMTQALLSSYHKVGISESVQGDLNAIKEVFNVSQQRKQEVIDIHFVNKDMTSLEARETLIDMEGVTIKGLIKNIEILTGDYNDSTLPIVTPWYSLFKETSGDIGLTFSTPLMFRLIFNTVHLMTYKIELGTIMDKLSNLRNIKMIPSPSFVGVIEIFIEPACVMNAVNEALQTTAHKISVVDALLKYFEKSVKPSLDKLVNSYGISGMHESAPIESNIMMKLDGRERRRPDGNWDVYGDHVEVMVRSIPYFKYENLFRLSGYEIVSYVYTKTKIHFVLRPMNQSTSNQSPLDIIRSNVTAASKRYNDHMNSAYENSRYVFDFEDPTWRASNYVSARANSRQIIEIMSHPLVDESLTVIRNEYLMYLYFGIEAAVNVMIREIDEIIKSNGKEISLRHTITIVNAMTRDGHIIPTTSKGTSKQGRESFSKAAFEKALAAVTSAAISGQPETTHSMATSILFGKQVEVGTGVSSVRIAKGSSVEYFKDNIGTAPDFNLPDYAGLNIEEEVLDARGLDGPSPNMNIFDFEFDGQNILEELGGTSSGISASRGSSALQAVGNFRPGSSIGNTQSIPAKAIGMGKRVTFSDGSGTRDVEGAVRPADIDDEELDLLFAQMD